MPNPLCKTMDQELREAKLELQELSSRYGWDALSSAEAKRRTMRGFRITASRIGRAIAAAERHVTRLSTKRKHLTDCLKMAAYQAESELTGLIAGHYRSRGG